MAYNNRRTTSIRRGEQQNINPLSEERLSVEFVNGLKIVPEVHHTISLDSPNTGTSIRQTILDEMRKRGKSTKNVMIKTSFGQVPRHIKKMNNIPLDDDVRGPIIRISYGYDSSLNDMEEIVRSVVSDNEIRKEDHSVVRNLLVTHDPDKAINDIKFIEVPNLGEGEEVETDEVNVVANGSVILGDYMLKDGSKPSFRRHSSASLFLNDSLKDFGRFYNERMTREEKDNLTSIWLADRFSEDFDIFCDTVRFRSKFFAAGYVIDEDGEEQPTVHFETVSISLIYDKWKCVGYTCRVNNKEALDSAFLDEGKSVWDTVIVPSAPTWVGELHGENVPMINGLSTINTLIACNGYENVDEDCDEDPGDEDCDNVDEDCDNEDPDPEVEEDVIKE